MLLHLKNAFFYVIQESPFYISCNSERRRSSKSSRRQRRVLGERDELHLLSGVGQTNEREGSWYQESNLRFMVQAAENSQRRFRTTLIQMNSTIPIDPKWAKFSASGPQVYKQDGQHCFCIQAILRSLSVYFSDLSCKDFFFPQRNIEN